MSEPTPRTRLIREHERGVYDRAEVYKILDAGFICHVGFVQDGQPFVIPTGYGRNGDTLYIHGSAASRMLKEEVTFSTSNVTSLDWDSYPILRFEECPTVTTIVVQHLDQKPSGGGEELMGPAAAATGQR